MTHPPPLNIYLYTAEREINWPFAAGYSDYLAPTHERASINPAYFQQVTDPAQADFFVFPYPLSDAINKVGIQTTALYLRNLPFLAEYAAKHVFFIEHDDSRPLGLGGIVVRCGANAIHADPVTIPMPYHSHDFTEMVEADFTALPYDTSFVGFGGFTSLRPAMVHSAANTSALRSFLRLRPVFFGHLKLIGLDEQTQAQYRAEFLDSLALSRTILCPRGEGEGSIRFFEAMSAGRVPIMLADEYALPFADCVPYDDLILRIPQSQAEQTGTILADWLTTHPPHLLQQMGRACRKAWEDFIRPEVYPTRLYHALLAIKNRPVTLPSPITPPADGWFAQPLRFTLTPQSTRLNSVSGSLSPAELKDLFVAAAALPQHSVIVYLSPTTPLEPITLAGGLAFSHNTDSIVYTIADHPVPGLQSAAEQARLAPWLRHLTAAPDKPVQNFSVREVDLLILDPALSLTSLNLVIIDWLSKIRFGGRILFYLSPALENISPNLQKFLTDNNFTCTIIQQTSTGRLAQIQFSILADFKRIFASLLPAPSPVLLGAAAAQVQLDCPADSPFPPAAFEILSLGVKHTLLTSPDLPLSPAQTDRLFTIAAQNPVLAVLAPNSGMIPPTDGTLIPVADPGLPPVVLNCHAVKVVGGINATLPWRQALTDLYRRLTALGFSMAVTPNVLLTPPVPVVRESLSLVFNGQSTPATHPSIALCMIVKNEEANLADCLRSAQDLAAETIIVDTGSTDRTVEIARQFGARVEFFPWIDDFAAARNESIKYAAADWILILAADDRLQPQDLNRIKQAVAFGQADAYQCRVVSPLTQAAWHAVNIVYLTSLFRNHNGVQFEDSIHETVTDSILRHGLTIAQTNITITHRGYHADAATLRRKAERNVRILQKCVAQEPTRLKWRYHLAVSLYQLQEFAGVIKQLETVVNHPHPDLNVNSHLYKSYVLLMSAYTTIPNRAKAEEILRRALAKFPHRRHLWITAGMFALNHDDPTLAIKNLEHARTLSVESDAEGESWAEGVLEAQLQTAYHLQGIQLIQQHQYLPAINVFATWLDLASPADRPEIYKLLALAFQKNGQEAESLACWQLSQQRNTP